VLLFAIFPSRIVLADSQGLNYQPVNVSQALSVTAYASAIDVLEKLKKRKDCMDSKTFAHLGKLSDGFQQSFTQFQAEISAYMSTIAKPMQGSGKCDGGFQSVALESSDRSQKSINEESRIALIHTALDLVYYQNYQNVEWNFDGSKDLSCALSVTQLGHKFDGSHAALSASFSQMKASLDGEAKVFLSYKQTNEKLAEDCGGSGGLSLSDRAPSSNGGATLKIGTIQGNSPQGVSSITGNTNDQTLP
jgi:hypothetical protein